MLTKKPFLTVKSDCHDAKWALVSLKNFPKTAYKSVQYFNLGHVHKPKVGLMAIAVSNISLPLSFLLGPFTLVPLRFIFFLAAVKT